MDVTRAQELVHQGTSPQALRRQAKAGMLGRVRHGAYATELGTDALARHRQLVAGTWTLLGEAAVLSHGSAAVLHGLPLWDGMLERVSITRESGGHGRTAPHLRVRLAPLTTGEVTEVEGLRVTTIERTALDLARTLPYEKGVAILDAALHAGADRATIADALALARGRSGVGTARAVLAFADGRSESVGESLSRIRLSDARLPAPELQLNVYDAAGNWLARSDFGWLGLGVLGEFDGRVKYIGPSDEVTEVVMRERRREALLRDAGWIVVRWGWSDLRAVELGRRVRGAFAQARPERITGHAVPLVRL